MLEDVQLVLSTYTRAFLAQGVGLVGLGWCLAEEQVLLGTILFGLLLSDQVVFLRARFAPGARPLPLRRTLNGGCLLVSFVDLLIMFAISYRALGLDVSGAPLAGNAVDDLAFSLASFAHLDTGLRASSPGGRFLAALEGILGWLALATIFWLGLRPFRSARRSETPPTADPRS